MKSKILMSEADLKAAIAMYIKQTKNLIVEDVRFLVTEKEYYNGDITRSAGTAEVTVEI